MPLLSHVRNSQCSQDEFTDYILIQPLCGRIDIQDNSEVYSIVDVESMAIRWKVRVLFKAHFIR
jgi:hypothetical protein